MFHILLCDQTMPPFKGENSLGVEHKRRRVVNHNLKVHLLLSNDFMSATKLSVTQKRVQLLKPLKAWPAASTAGKPVRVQRFNPSIHTLNYADLIALLKRRKKKITRSTFGCAQANS